MQQLRKIDRYKGKTAAIVECGYERVDVIVVEEDEDVFKYGMVSRPKNPYFVTKLRTNRQNELYVPVYVLRDHNLKLPQKLILLDQEGRKWSSKVECGRIAGHGLPEAGKLSVN